VCVEKEKRGDLYMRMKGGRLTALGDGVNGGGYGGWIVTKESMHMLHK
jgi:hypothetical protein